jgi:hypothetical protein
VLNWAVRYYPILRALKPHLSETSALLEIGSGSIGIGKFRRAPFVGCDIKFQGRPKAPMLPVLASGTSLPFGDRCFDAVVASDVLEHVPPDQRIYVVREALRVARKIAIFGFPSGTKAFEYDVKLAELCDRSRRVRPDWLQEHLQCQPLPTEHLFDELQGEWEVSSFDNANVAFHNWVMRLESHRLWVYFFDVFLAALPRLMEYLLQRADCEPYYRKIVVVQRP